MTTVVMTLPSRATTNNTDSTNSVDDGDDSAGGLEESGIVELEVSNGQEHVGGSSEGTDGSGCDEHDSGSFEEEKR